MEMDSQDKELAEQVARFNRLFKSYDDIFRQAARRFQLPDLSLWILYVVQEISSCTRKDLTTILLQSKQSIQSALRRLQDEGVVTLETDSEDRRLKRIRLTGKGREISVRTADRIVGAERRAYARLAAADRARLLELFAQLSEAFRAEMDEL